MIVLVTAHVNICKCWGGMEYSSQAQAYDRCFLMDQVSIEKSKSDHYIINNTDQEPGSLFTKQKSKNILCIFMSLHRYIGRQTDRQTHTAKTVSAPCVCPSVCLQIL